jgi:hypothetical protein
MSDSFNKLPRVRDAAPLKPQGKFYDPNIDTFVEDDAPRSRKTPEEFKTVAVDARTTAHRGASTDQLPVHQDVPAGIPREPTVIVAAPGRADPPTAVMTAADLPAPERGGFDRVAWSADRIADTAEALAVDRKRHAAEVLRGQAKAMQAGPTKSPLEYVSARLMTRALLADAGVGPDLDEHALSALLLELATAVLAGIDPARKAGRDLANELDTKASSYRRLAGKARERGDLHGAGQHTAAMDALSEQARLLRKRHR